MISKRVKEEKYLNVLINHSLGGLVMNKIIINSKDEIKNIMKNLNSINQIMKSIRIDKTYTISNGRAFAPPNKNYDEKNNNKNCGWHFANLKIDIPYLEKYTFLIKGDEYYSFYKEFKDNVKEIHIINDNINNGIIFYTILDSPIGQYNLFMPINSDECKYDIENIEKYSKIFIDDTTTIYLLTEEEHSVDDSFIDQLESIDQIPQTIIFGNNFKVRFTKKLLPTLNKSSKLSYKIYKLKSFGNYEYFIIQFTTERKELNMIDAYACINY
jgi:hypothetical protein